MSEPGRREAGPRRELPAPQKGAETLGNGLCHGGFLSSWELRTQWSPSRTPPGPWQGAPSAVREADPEHQTHTALRGLGKG